MYCKNCGKKIANNSKFCSYCGCKQDQLDKNYQIENPTKKQPINENKKQQCTINQEINLETTPKKATKKNKKWVIKLIVWLCILALMVVICITLYNNKQNEFSIGISNSDYRYIYDDSDGEEVISTIIPKYDFKNFSIEITYYAERGLLNSYKEEYNIGDIKAGTQLQFSKPISDIEEEIDGSFSYADVSIKSGKKQFKHYNPTQEIEYNTECDLAFSLHHPSKMSIYMDITITNKTNYYISELRNFRVTVCFGDKKTTQFYTPRIKLKEKLAPNQSITVEGLTGNFTSQGIDLSTNPYISSNYYAQIYQVIYS